MGNAGFSNDFRQDAVSPIVVLGCPVSEVSARLGVSQHSWYV